MQLAHSYKLKKNEDGSYRVYILAHLGNTPAFIGTLVEVAAWIYLTEGDLI